MSGRKSDNHPRRKPIRRGWIIGIRELLFAQFIKGDSNIPLPIFEVAYPPKRLSYSVSPFRYRSARPVTSESLIKNVPAVSSSATHFLDDASTIANCVLPLLLLAYSINLPAVFWIVYAPSLATMVTAWALFAAFASIFPFATVIAIPSNNLLAFNPADAGKTAYLSPFSATIRYFYPM